MEHDEQMLSALLADEITAPVATIPRSEQELYLDKYISSVPTDDRREIAHIIVAAGSRELLRECPDGIVVDLSALPDTVIRKMYDLLKYIREKRFQGAFQPGV